MTAVPMIELWRGGMLESVHAGHAVVFGPGGIEAAWGDPEAVIFPRSSCKMLQALPLLESGAADAAGLSERQLALSCASHSGAALHRDAVAHWLSDLGMAEGDLRCGVHMPWDKAENTRLTCTHETPCQLHNNCSGKHAGFLTLNRHLKGGSEYVEIDHPVQRAVKAAFEEVTQETSPGYGIDGCSAPNFACTVTGLARAMQFFAAANPEGSIREAAAARLARAMAAFPEMVAGEERACTRLMRAMGGTVAVKTGAEAVYIAILPAQKRGIALKIVDGGTRASEAAITALLVKLGALDPAHPVVEELIPSVQKNWRGLVTGGMRLAPGFA
ncbi:asparaginase [Paenirhodobacter hankyongi]|uniref:Asparaginase n=1 Tax=Paenirhodobacter hankyongi TaxID=2294033 RepID=A0A421BVG8_9RHOB|nr:asparaginase [Sinirhodobacter hankyongi]RLL72304.1 asparaginase [Sinirhodobacter hankyongi]